MDEYIKKDTVIDVLRELRDECIEISLIEGAGALSDGINAVKAIEADGVKPVSYTISPLANERAVVERALGIIEGATAALRCDERYEGVEGMLITAVEMIEHVLNKGD